MFHPPHPQYTLIRWDVGLYAPSCAYHWYHRLLQRRVCLYCVTLTAPITLTDKPHKIYGSECVGATLMVPTIWKRWLRRGRRSPPTGALPHLPAAASRRMLRQHIRHSVPIQDRSGWGGLLREGKKNKGRNWQSQFDLTTNVFSPK